MIHIVEGVPGSGKSYYAVNYLIQNFFDYDSFYNEYKEKENKNVLVITNIEDLKVKHLNLDILLDRFTLEKFFTVDNFERIQKQYRVKNIIVIIDEAQRYFDRKFYNKDVFYFFQYHRHLGVDIFLITQSKNTISKELVVLAEYIIRAVPRSLQVGAFRYKFYDVNGNFLFSKSLKKDKKVFNAYSSMKVEEVNKPKNVIYSKIAFAVFSFVFVLFSVPLVLKFFWLGGGSSTESVKIESSKTVSSVKVSKSHSVSISSVPSSVSPSVSSSVPDTLVVPYLRDKYYHNSICSGKYCLLFSSSYLDTRVRLYGSSSEDSESSNIGN